MHVNKAFNFLGRKLNKKLFSNPLILGVLAKVLLLIPAAIAGLGFLVVKSVVVAKIALLIAGILGMQKYFGTSSAASFFSKAAQPFENNAVSAWGQNQAAAPSQGYYSRSFNVKSDPHSMAYSAQAPASKTE